MTEISIGKVVYSKSGRDAGRAFIIVGIINDEYVYISDGDLRPIEKPKKKKIKHLYISNVYAERIKVMLEQQDKVSNREIIDFLKHMNSNKEV